jgi:hypothetical protein
MNEINEAAFGEPEVPVKPKRQKRSKTLIADFSTGFAAGWVFAVPKSFRSSLDIAMTERIVTTKTIVDGKTIKSKKSVWQWTQGKNYSFIKGSMLHDSPLAYTLTWGEAKIHITMTVQIADIESNGVLVVRVYRGLDPTHELVRCTPEEFVSLLRDGTMVTVDGRNVIRQQ